MVCDEPEVVGLFLRFREYPQGPIIASTLVVGDEWIGTVKGLIVPPGFQAIDFRAVILAHMRAKGFKRVRWSRHRELPDGTSKVDWKEFAL